MFNYICEECGEGIVQEKTFHNYHTRVKGYHFMVDKAIIGVCDKCGAKHFDANETKRWEELYFKDLESKRLFLQPENIKTIRKSLNLSMEDFAYLTGCTRQSLYNWENKDRAKPQSRMADLMMKLVQRSSDNGEIDVIRFLIEEANKNGIKIEIVKNNVINAKEILLGIKKQPQSYLENIKGLAAKSNDDKELTVAESADKKLIGILQYDYVSASLTLKVLQDSVGLRLVNCEIVTNDNKRHIVENTELKNGLIQLLSKTEYDENSIKSILLRQIIK